MIAASARTSGTTLPVSSNLKRGSMASRSAAACWAALVRAARTRRLLAAGFFAVVAVVAFAVVAVVVVVVVVVAFLTTGFLQGPSSLTRSSQRPRWIAQAAQR